MINGLLIPGGNYPLKFSTRWFKTASILFQLAKDANDRGDFFPVRRAQYDSHAVPCDSAATASHFLKGHAWVVRGHTGAEPCPASRRVCQPPLPAPTLPARNIWCVQVHGTCLGMQLLVTLVCHDEYALTRYSREQYFTCYKQRPRVAFNRRLQSLVAALHCWLDPARNQQLFRWPLVNSENHGLRAMAVVCELFSFALPTSVDAHDHPSRLVLTEAGRRSSFLAALPGSVLQDYQDHDIAMHNHFYGEMHGTASTMVAPAL